MTLAKKLETARREGEALAELSDERPCIRCLKSKRQCGWKEAAAYASGHENASRALGRLPKVVCPCVLHANSPFLS